MATATIENAVKERPILFSAPMVKAILAGTKVQTRRIVKADFTPAPARLELWRDVWVPTSNSGKVGIFEPDFVKCPYGKVGDRLYCKETWAPIDRIIDGCERDDPTCVGYRATQTGIRHEGGEKIDIDVYGLNWDGIKWKSSMFMPRWASRITLEITNIRVERLNEISGRDCVAEGCKLGWWRDNEADETPPMVSYGPEREAYILRKEYRAIWESINGAGSWQKNPFVWVLEFKRLEAENNAK